MSVEFDKDRLMDVADYIEVFEERYDQNVFFVPDEAWYRNRDPLSTVHSIVPNAENMCGSTACVAGTMVMLDRWVNNQEIDWSRVNFADEAAKLLFGGRNLCNLTGDERDFIDTLFDGANGPQHNVTASEALRRIAKGESIVHWWTHNCGCDECVEEEEYDDMEYEPDCQCDHCCTVRYRAEGGS